MSPFECVPNFSEGRDAAKVRRIADAANGPGVVVLDVEWNADHHRSVVTLVGEGDALVDGLVRMMRVATESIDLNQHHGEHPRIGATDVVPFVPLGSSTIAEAVALAGRLGERVYRELGIPVYLYGAAARTSERVELPPLRRGGFEGLREAVGKDPARAPDIGDARLHPTAGAVAIGVRPVLVAFNANLDTADVAVAKAIAHAVRGRDGGLPELRALGFSLHGPDRAQVSMNLTDYRVTPIHRALEAVRAEAAKRGARVVESEIVGLVPEDALVDAAEHYLALRGFSRDAILERKVRAATPPPGEPFAEFLRRLAARTPTPGGGSAAAAAGALGAALGEMVLAYSVAPGATDPQLGPLQAALTEHRTRFLAAMTEDARAYDDVRRSRQALRLRADDPAARAQYAAALEHACRVPLSTAADAAQLARQLRAIGPRTKAALASDLLTGLALLRAAKEGALANVRANLEEVRRAGRPVEALESEVARLGAPEA